MLQRVKGMFGCCIPSSAKIEFESDKITFMLSTVLFLSNRLTKAIIGLPKMDKAINDVVKKEKQSLDNGNDENKGNYENMDKKLNEKLAQYF
ncbi:MAG: hypothetical protein H0X03_00440 [Nitrosopumilus sp.]|nr:hypothetical protein [Nitrosopumilus sp.]